MPHLGLVLFHAAPALLYLVRLAALPVGADRFLAALIIVTQVASLASAARRMARGLASPGDRVEAALITGAIFFAVPAVVVSWLGAAGLARPLPVAIACGAIAIALHLRAPEEPAASPPAAKLDRFEIGMLAFIGLVIGRLTISTLREAPRDADSVWYHLTTAAEIARTGSIRPNEIVTDIALGYPAAREAIVAWLMMPFRSTNLALLFPIEIAVAVTALYAIVRSFDVDRPAALAAAAVFAACPAVATAAIEQKNDLFLAMAFLLTWYFLRQATRKSLRHHTVMAGVAGGLLVSTKFTGVILLGVLLAHRLVADALAEHRLPRSSARAATVLGLAALVGGVWYARNLLQFHDPVYPKPIAIFGHTIFPGLADVDRQYALTKLGLSPGRVLRFADQFVAGLGPAVTLAVVPPIAAPIAAWRGAARLPKSAALCLGALPVVLFVVYASLPYSVHPRGNAYWYVQPRFLLPFLCAVCAGLAALVPDRPRYRDIGLAALAALAAGGASISLSPRSLFGVLAISLAAAVFPLEEIRFTLERPRLGAAAAAIGLILAAFVATRVEAYRERAKNDPEHGYRADPVEGWGDVSLWVRANVRGARILYTGTIQMFPLYGPGLTNTLFWFKTDPRRDDSEALYRAAIERDADYIVSFAPVTLRFGARGERFQYGPSPNRAIAQRHPDDVELAFAAGHADVARIKRRPKP